LGDAATEVQEERAPTRWRPLGFTMPSEELDF
jgi:hypothetical protein